MGARAGVMLRPDDPELDRALAEIFGAEPEAPLPEYDVERLLRRAKRSAGLPEWPTARPANRRPRQRNTGLAQLACLLVILLALGGAAWYRGDTLAGAAATQRAIEDFRPVRAPFSPAEVEGLAAKITPSLVDVETDLGWNYGGAGTGILLTRSGEVLTNNHVINGARAVSVVAKANGRRYPADVLGYDRTRDIALLQIRNPGQLSPATLGDSAELRIGEPVLGIGNAGGLGGVPVRAPGTVKETGVSISTSDELTSSKEQLNGLVKVLADIQPGDSGGPLVNEAGHVVGVNTAATVTWASTVPTSGGIGYAILIDDAMAAVSAIRAGHSTDQVHVGPTAMLGAKVSGPPVGPDNRVITGARPGAVVTGLGFPVLSAGLRRADTIVSIDGAPVDTPTRLTAIIGRHAPGDRVTVGWITGAGQERAAVVTLAEGPPA